MVFRANIDLELVTRLKVDAERRHISTTALIHNVLYDYVHGVRRIGAHSMIPKPAKMTPTERAEAKRYAALKKVWDDTVRELWGAYAPEHFAMFADAGCKSRETFSMLYPNRDPDEFFEPGTTRPLPYLLENKAQWMEWYDEMRVHEMREKNMHEDNITMRERVRVTY